MASFNLLSQQNRFFLVNSCQLSIVDLTTQKLESNTEQTAKGKEERLTEGVWSNSTRKNLVPPDQGTLWYAKRQQTKSQIRPKERSQAPVPEKHKQWGVRARPKLDLTESVRKEEVKPEAIITARVFCARGNWKHMPMRLVLFFFAWLFYENLNIQKDKGQRIWISYIGCLRVKRCGK